MQWANQFVDDLYLKADSVFNTIQIYPNLDSNLKMIGDEDVETQLESYAYMRDMLNVFYYSNSMFIDRLSVGSKAGLKSFVIDSSIQRVLNETDQLKPWENASMYFEGTQGIITIHRAIKQFEDRQTIGYISIRLKESVTSQLLNILQIDKNSSVYLLDENNNLILSSGSNSELSDLSVIDYSKTMQTINHDLVFTTTVRGGDLKVIKVVPQTIISQNTSLILIAGVLISMLFVGLAIYLSYVFSTRITKPIMALANTMKNDDIDAFKMREIDNQNEIGLLEVGYNTLMLRTKNLIDQEYKREIELKSAQLKALQAQINPHFLYNILQMVGGIALSHNVHEIYNITNAISDLFRYSISGNSDLVTLEDEIKHIKNYLYIQKLRFGDRIVMDLQADPEVVKFMIPKFTLQPLVENAFEHGLHEITKNGELKVTILEVEDHIEIHVRDNGEGMSPELVDALEENLSKQQSVKEQAVFGIGMKNVDSRLKLIFGSDYSFVIQSEAGLYTEIILTVPKRYLEDQHV